MSYIAEAKITRPEFLAPLRGYEDSLKLLAGEVACAPEGAVWRPATERELLWTVEEVIQLMERLVIFVEPEHWWARGVGV